MNLRWRRAYLLAALALTGGAAAALTGPPITLPATNPAAIKPLIVAGILVMWGAYALDVTAETLPPPAALDSVEARLRDLRRLDIPPPGLDPVDAGDDPDVIRTRDAFDAIIRRSWTTTT